MDDFFAILLGMVLVNHFVRIPGLGSSFGPGKNARAALALTAATMLVLALAAGVDDADERGPLVGVLGKALDRQRAGTPLGVEGMLVEVELADDRVQLGDPAAHRVNPPRMHVSARSSFGRPLSSAA